MCSTGNRQVRGDRRTQTYTARTPADLEGGGFDSAYDLRLPEDEALEAVRQFIIGYEEETTSRSWQRSSGSRRLQSQPRTLRSLPSRAHRGLRGTGRSGPAASATRPI